MRVIFLDPGKVVSRPTGRESGWGSRFRLRNSCLLRRPCVNSNQCDRDLPWSNSRWANALLHVQAGCIYRHSVVRVRSWFPEVLPAQASLITVARCIYAQDRDAGRLNMLEQRKFLVSMEFFPRLNFWPKSHNATCSWTHACTRHSTNACTRHCIDIMITGCSKKKRDSRITNSPPLLSDLGISRNGTYARETIIFFIDINFVADCAVDRNRRTPRDSQKQWRHGRRWVGRKVRKSWKGRKVARQTWTHGWKALHMNLPRVGSEL